MKQNCSKTKTVVRVIAFLLIVALVYGALTRRKRALSAHTAPHADD